MLDFACFFTIHALYREVRSLIARRLFAVARGGSCRRWNLRLTPLVIKSGWRSSGARAFVGLEAEVAVQVAMERSFRCNTSWYSKAIIIFVGYTVQIQR